MQTAWIKKKQNIKQINKSHEQQGLVKSWWEKMLFEAYASVC